MAVPRRLAVFLLAALAVVPAQVRKVPASEGWFPDQAEALKQVLDNAFRTAEKRVGRVPPRKRLLGIIAPHAGLAYSGAIAAAAYSRFDHPSNVVVLAFSHSRAFSGVRVPALAAYETPLGRIEVNREAVRALGFSAGPAAELADHSLDNQLPFIQRAAPGVRVIPLFVGELEPEELAAAARKLVGRLKQGDVIVASSDLTHYGAAYGYTPFPVTQTLPARLRDRAYEIFERIGSLSTAQFEALVAGTHDNLCGFGPIQLLMATLAAWNEEVYMSPVDYMASGELTGDYRLSVGYGALAFYPASAFEVAAADQARLLASSRRTLAGFLAGGGRQREPVGPAERGRDLEQRSALFVTLKKDGELRGCVGSFAPRLPLGDAVAEQTLEAAAEDPRFPPVSARDGALGLEISLLTPLKRLASWRDFRLGQGAVIALDGKSGTLLPQIAGEMHWNREQMLENLALKAGLPAKAYKDPRALLYVYQAQVFGDSAPARAARGR
ncbi:MAG TPA: AmmeMemoRadiSam system protein B [Bryobacteraceae bacterium]|nr:AmmeMemoRadiSam system protein B [Bryobacteraceae bacterium]